MLLACGTSSTHAPHLPNKIGWCRVQVLMCSDSDSGSQPWAKANGTKACSGQHAASPKTTPPLVTPSQFLDPRRHTQDSERERSPPRSAPHTAPPTPHITDQQTMNRHRVVLHRSRAWAG